MNIFEQIKQNFNKQEENTSTFPIAAPSIKQLNNLIEGQENGMSISFSSFPPTTEERVIALENAFAEFVISLTGGDIQ